MTCRARSVFSSLMLATAFASASSSAVANSSTSDDPFPTLIDNTPSGEIRQTDDSQQNEKRNGTATEPKALNKKPRFIVKPPAGFEDLQQAQTTLVDVYYGNQLIANTMATFDNKAIEFLDPEWIVARTPHLTAKKDIVQALTGELVPVEAPDCHESDREFCQTPQPSVAAITFDPQQFRVDLYINPRFVETLALDQQNFLDDPTKTFSSIHFFDFLLSGDNEENHHATTLNSVLAYGKTRLNLGLRADDGYGESIETLRLEHDHRKWTYALGTMDMTGLVSPLLNTSAFIGVRAARTLKMRRDLRLVQSSPIFVYLDQRSRVDILRDGKLLSSRYYNQGNRQIDTSNLPDGSYEIVLRVGNSRGTREEKHLFTRTSLLPPPDHALHFFESGEFIDTDVGANKRESLQTSGHQLIHIGSRFRLSNNIGAEAEVLALPDFEDSAQSGLYYYLPRFSLHGGMLHGDAKTTGHYLNLNLHFAAMNFNISHHRLDRDRPELDKASRHPALRAGENTSLVLSTNIGRGQLLASVSQRETETEPEKLVQSLKYSRNLFRIGTGQLRFNADWNNDDDDQKILFSLQYNAREKTLDRSVSGGWTRSDDELTNGAMFNASITQKLLKQKNENGRNSLFLRNSQDTRTVGLRLDRRGHVGSGYFESRVIDTTDVQSYSYSAGAHLTITQSSKQLALSSQKQGLAGVMVKVDNEKTPYDIEIDHRNITANPTSGEQLVLLEPYREYEVSLRPRGERLMRFDNASRKVTLYPGNVTRLDWKLSPVFVVVGKAVHPDHTAVSNSRFTNLEEYSGTDESGWFQVELASMQILRLKSTDGSECEVDLSGEQPPVEEQVVVLDELACRPSGNAGTLPR